MSLLLIYQQKKICIRIVIHIVDHLQPIEAAELDLPAKRKDVGNRNVNCKLAQSSFGEMRRKLGEAFWMAYTRGDGTCS